MNPFSLVAFGIGLALSCAGVAAQTCPQGCDRKFEAMQTQIDALRSQIDRTSSKWLTWKTNVLQPGARETDAISLSSKVGYVPSAIVIHVMAWDRTSPTGGNPLGQLAASPQPTVTLQRNTQGEVAFPAIAGAAAGGPPGELKFLLDDKGMLTVNLIKWTSVGFGQLEMSIVAMP